MIVSVPARCTPLSNYPRQKLTGCASKMLDIYPDPHLGRIITSPSTLYLLVLLCVSTVLSLSLLLLPASHYFSSSRNASVLQWAFSTIPVTRHVHLNQQDPSMVRKTGLGHAYLHLLIDSRFRSCRRVDDISSPLHNLSGCIHPSLMPDLRNRIYETSTAFQ